MNCADVRPVLQIYIDNEVSALDARPIEEHLRDCPECRDQAQFYHRQDALLREAVTSLPEETDLLRQRIQRLLDDPQVMDGLVALFRHLDGWADERALGGAAPKVKPTRGPKVEHRPDVKPAPAEARRAEVHRAPSRTTIAAIPTIAKSP